MMWAVFDRLIAVDQGLFFTINGGWASPALDVLMVFVTLFGDGFFLAGVVMPILYFGDRENFVRRAPVIIIAVGVGGLVNTVIKEAVGRPRPLLEFADEIRMGTAWVHTVFEGWKSNSFPSGHAQTAFGAAAALSYYYRGWVPPLTFGAALMVCLSRVYLGVHFPLDVVCGAIIGTACSLSVCHMWEKSMPRYRAGKGERTRDFLNILRAVRRIRKNRSTDE